MAEVVLAQTPSEVKVLGTVDGKDRGGKPPESGKQNTALVFVGEIRVFLYRCKQMRIKLPWMFLLNLMVL